MKTIFVVLISAALFAQNPYPDTLLLKDGRSFPCLISSLDESNVEIIYLKGRKEKTSLLTVEHIYLEDKGIIYTAVNGFKKNDPEQFENYLRTRMIVYESQQVAEPNEENLNMPVFDYAGKTDNCSPKNKWSFGVLLVPYYSGIVYSISGNIGYPPYEPYIIVSGINEINMEAQLAYALLNNVSLTLDLSYTASYYESRSESHLNSSGGYNYESGSLTKNDLSLFDFTLGLKYYLTRIENKVRIYALAGFGKQFAFAEKEDRNLFPEPGQYITIDNEEEFIEEINSPFHFNLGFGAEYFFNESLSLTSNIRFFYSSYEGSYYSRRKVETETAISTIEEKDSDISTRVGLGLNFYF